MEPKIQQASNFDSYLKTIFVFLYSNLIFFCQFEFLDKIISW